MTTYSTAGTAYTAIDPVLPAVAHAYWTQERVARALNTGPNAHWPFGGVSTDTRRITRGDLFVALRGDVYDAHDFLADARDRGAAALVVSDATKAVGLGLPVYIVPDTLVALGQLGTAWRRAWGRSVIAVAGSNGKTSTKELLKAALGRTLNVHATAGNFNNLVGVPLTLLAIPSDAEVAVVELGTNAPGEIATLRAMVLPDVAVMTSIGEEHLEGLGDLAGVLREESDVFDGVTLAVVPSAQPEVARAATGRARAIISAGLVDADVQPAAWALDDEGRPWFDVDGVRFTLPLRGAHQAANAMLAVATARACGVSLTAAAEGMAAMPVPNMHWTCWHASATDDSASRYWAA
jgi:UDP-N-acetylmuramoyl-tripeptide--D-alanyl-D-alanine ligase